MDATARDAAAAQKNPIESLSKDEIISKYKGLLTIAKKAKQAKDDLTEENRQLKDALTRAAAKQSSLPAMQEMLQDFTDKNLILTEQVSALQRKSKEDSERLSQLDIENESLRRQLTRLSDENDDLLANVERMEQAMQQVNDLGSQQRKNLELLELDIAKNKEEIETQNDNLKQQIATTAAESQQRLAELQQLQEKYQNVKDLNSEQRKKFNTLKDRFIDVHRKLKNLKQCRCVLLETQHEYAASVSKWQQEIVKASQLLCAKMTTLQQENEELKSQLAAGNHKATNLNRTKLLQLVSELERIAQVVKQQQQQQERPRQSLNINGLLTKLNDMERLASIAKEQFKQPPANSLNVNELSHKLVLMQRLTEILKQERNQQHLDYQRVQQELQDLKAQMQDNAGKLVERQVRAQNNEYAELKAQLEASQATVAKLQEEVHKKAHKGKHQQQLLEQLKDVQARYQQKESEHSELLAEMRELNEALKARGDVISRMQEQQALEAKNVSVKHKELEAKLEQEKQAMQLKCQQIEELRAKTNELEQEMQQHANADAQSDVLSTSTISRAEELQRLRELDDGYEEKYNKLRALAAKLKKKLQEQIQQIKQLDEQAAAAAELKAEVESIKLAQTQLQQDLNAARAENQKLKSKGKNTSVLNLEIEAAEKSLDEVSAKLTLKSTELDALNDLLKSKENTNAQLRKEIKILEAEKNSETAHAKQLKEQIDRMQCQVKDAVHSQQNASVLNKELEQCVERLKLEIEELRLQLATSTQQHEESLQKSNKMMSTTSQELQSRLNAMGELESALRKAERAHEDLRVEYLDYKVKAQAVLRKNQSKGSDKEYELQEEVNMLRASEQSLRASNEQQLKNMAQLEKHLELLQEDNTNLQRRSKELMNLIEDLRQQNDTIAHDNHRHLLQKQEQLQQQRQQIDQMDDAHKLQLHKLQKQLEQAQQALQNMPNALPSVASYTMSAAPTAPIKSDEQSKIDFLLMDHDHTGEYSSETLNQLAAQRKISTASRRSHDFMPLDELLNTSLNAINSDTVTTISNFGRSVSMQEDDVDLENHLEYASIQQAQSALQATKERLGIQESRVRHLTSLLSENEQDLARLTQMNDMLKEELRRQERSEEREQHMHNSEYLKNVFLKFVTLNSVDERSRLVPVLNKILRLSQTEIEMLNCAAKGQKVSNDGSNRGWSSFLPGWSGGSASSNNN